MIIEMFNFWYFFWIAASVGVFIALYFLLRGKREQIQSAVLFSLLAFALILHFLKAFIPPYSTDHSRWLRDSWFVNICGANIALFPFLFLSKSKTAKDYMFYIGILGGLVAIFLPLEPIKKLDQASELLDVIRFYVHHNILWYVPLLMVMLKIHTLDYKRVWKIPGCFMLLLLFIMLNQILQSELGFVPLRGDDITAIGYKNTSYIWGPDDEISKIITPLCPNIFKTIPVGKLAGTPKYWPWFWLLVPAHVVLIPLCFLMSMIFEHKHFKTDILSIRSRFIKPRQNHN